MTAERAGGMAEPAEAVRPPVVSSASAHDHDDHDHGHDEDLDAAEDAWPPSESVTLVTVGIDVGSATSHMMFSRLVLERQGRNLSSRYAVVAREVMWSSDIWLTPYADARTIDAQRLAGLVQAAHEAAGVSKDEVDSGAVIITGEAARKQNAQRIVDALALHAGRFVCPTAGPVLEGVLAAHGSGAIEESRRGGPVLNVDIGGGTTKLSLVRDGHVAQVHAINVGGRLIAWDEERRAIRVEDAGAALAAAAGVRVRLGETISSDDALKIARLAARIIVDAMRGGEVSSSGSFCVTPALADHDACSAMFSGGVGRLVVEDDATTYGDLGAGLALAVKRRLDEVNGWQLLPSRETVRATCVGVSQFTVQLSGNTIFVSDPTILPLRNLRVFAVPDLVLDDAQGVAECISTRLARSELVERDGDHGGARALSLKIPAPRSPRDVNALADGLAAALAHHISGGAVLVVALDQDIASVLGHAVTAETGGAARLVVIDQVEIGELDFIDVGSFRADTGTVPIVVKSLVF